MKSSILASAIFTLLGAGSAHASTLSLLPQQSTDMVPTTLLARASAGPNANIPQIATVNVAAPRVHVERAPISVSWPLSHGSSLQSVPQPFARSSREYWRDVSASELQQGVPLSLTAPGAIIRLSPGDGNVGKLDPNGVHLLMGRQSFTAASASRQVADAATMQTAGMAVPAATVMMQLKPSLGTGVATLQVPAAAGRYVVHVLEPNSPFTLTATGDRDDLLLGHDVHVRVVMQNNGSDMPLNTVGGSLRAPDGSSTPLTFQRQADGSYTVDARPAHIPSTPGLWEVHSFTSGVDAAGQEIRRDTTTVFAAALPDAKFSGTASTASTGDHGIDIKLGVLAQSASRYAASAVLYGRGSNGEMVPAAYAQSAAWLKAGSGQLTLHYDPTSLKGVSAPYELHDLRLQDQPAISLLERRAVAMRFGQP